MILNTCVAARIPSHFYPEYSTSAADGTIVYTEEGLAADGVTKNWNMLVLSNATVEFSKDVGDVEVFLVGGGGGGGTPPYGDRAGGGGGGGYTTTGTVTLKKGIYDLVIGSGGKKNADGKSTTAFGFSADGGKAPTDKYTGGAGTGKGGNGAFGNNSSGANAYEATPGGDGVYAFGDASFKLPNFEDVTCELPSLESEYKFGAGGGGAWNRNPSWVYSYGNNAGGASGGGKGGEISKGANGKINSGGGGGGGSFAGNAGQDSSGNYYDYSHSYDGGEGGSGIVIIRNARS